MIRKTESASKGKKPNTSANNNSREKKASRKPAFKKKVIRKNLNLDIENIWSIQEKYHAMVEQASEALFIHDFNGSIVEVNKRACDELGYTREEILKLNVVDIEQDFNLEQAKKEWKKIKPGDYYTLDGHQKRKDGSVFPVEVRFGTFKMKNKKYFLGFVRNITERRKVENEIKNKEKNFHSTLDNMMEGCQILSFDWVYLFINKAAERHNKRPKEELLGKKYKDMWPGIENTEVFRVIKDTLEIRIAHKMENKFEYPDGSLGWFELSIQPVPEGVFILSADITERKINEEALYLGEKKYRYLFDSNPFPMWVYDLKTLNYLDVNESAIKNYGYTKEEFLKMSLRDIRPEEDVKALLKDVSSTRNLLNNAGIWRHKKKSGEIIFVEIVSHLIDFEGKPARLVLANNVTEKIQAENKLKESENHYRTLADSGHALIWTSGTDRKCDYFNKPWLDFTGRKLEQELGDGWTEGVHPDDLQRCLEIYNSAFDKREKFSMEYRLKNFKREYRWIIDDGNPRYNSEGKFIGYIGYCIDITERKLAEDRIKESENRFKKIYDEGPYGMTLTDKDNRFVMANKTFCSMVGYSEDELKKMKLSEFGTEETSKNEVKIAKQLIGKEISVHKIEAPIKRKDGKMIWVSTTAVPNFSDDGKFLYNLAMVEDITERMIQEEKIRHANERFRKIYEDGPYGMVMAGSDFKFVAANKKFCDIMGYSEDELKMLRFIDITFEEDKQKDIDNIKKLMIREINVYKTEKRYVRKDGKIIWCRLTVTANYSKENEFMYNLGMIEDITDKKKSEESLGKLTERLNLATRASQIGIWDWDIVNNVIIWDEMMYKIYGRKKDDFGGAYEAWLDAVHPDDRDASFEVSQKAVKGEIEYNTEFRIAWPDGSVRWIKADGEVFRNNEGKAVRMVGVNYDITVRKNFEEDLRMLTERLNLATSAAQIGIWELDLNSYTFVWDEISCRIFGVDQKTVDSSYANWLNLMHPEDRKDFIVYSENILNKGGDIDVEFRIIRNGGLVKWIKSKGEVIYDRKGNPVKMVGVNYDITEQKNAEESVRLSEERFSKIFNESPIPMVIADSANTKILDTNISNEKLMGYSKEELIGKHPFELDIYPEKEQIERYKELREKFGEKIGIEMTLRKKSGELRDVIIWRNVLKLNDNFEIKLGTALDITDEKRAKQLLETNEERLRQIVETSGVWVWEVDKDGVYTYVSKMEEGILGYKTEEIIGKKHFYDFFIPEEREHLKNAAHDVFSRKEMFRNFENPNVHKNGDVVYLETSGIPLLDDAGNLIGYRGADRDITERKKVEIEIKKFNEELEKRVNERTSELKQSNMDLEAFAYSVSHDLRAPLRAISGFSGLLLEDHYEKLDEEGKEYIQDIMRNAKKMGNLIDDLLHLSRYGRKQVEKSVIKMHQLILTVFKEEKKNYDSIAELKTSNLPDISGDYTLIKQLIINLISNAIKFSSKNPKPVIEAGFTETEKEITYFIKDNGVGFDMKYSEKLFGVFQRLHKAEEFSGTGVGLAIVSRIIAKHNGKIRVDSKPGEGAIFYFTLPKD